jgi:hypothetical protein
MELSIATGNATAIEAQTVESVLPEHFESSAPELIKLLKAYYRHLNKELSASYELNNLIRQHDVDVASEKYLDVIERMVGSAIPQNRSLDRVRLYKVIADYYNSRGSEESVYAFFRIFYNEFVTLVYPKELLFSTSDPDKGTISTENRIRDSYRWQEFSYVVNSGTDQAEWINEYLKFVHPAGLKFFVALTLEIFADNDWVQEALEYYLNVTKVVKLTSELPTGENAPDDGTLYIVTDGDDSESPVTKFNNIPRVFEYNTETSPAAWAETDSVQSFADWIDWSTFFGQHTPQDQYLNVAFTYMIKVLMGDGGYHYLTHVRSIYDQHGESVVDRDLLKAFFNNLIISYRMLNDNTIQTAFRAVWNKDIKFVDNAGWGEFGEATIAEADSDYTKYSDGGFKYPSAFAALDQSADPYLDFIDADTIVEDWNEPSESPITYVPSSLSSSEYTEGWVAFVFYSGDESEISPWEIDQNLIRYTSATADGFIHLYDDRIEFGDDTIQVGDVYVNGDLILDRDETNYSSTDSNLDFAFPLLGGGWKHVLCRVKWKIPSDTITSESGIDPEFRAIYTSEAFSTGDLNITKFRSNLPTLLDRIQGVTLYTDTPSEYKVSYNTHFNNFSTGALIDFFTLSFQSSPSISEFDLIFDPDASPQVTETFTFTGITEVTDSDSPPNVIDIEHRYDSSTSDLYFLFSVSEGYWALYDGSYSPDILLQKTVDQRGNTVPEINTSEFTWEVQETSEITAISSATRFINIVYDLGWTDQDSPYDSPLNSRSFLSGFDDDSPGYEYDTRTDFLNSFKFTKD